MEFKEFYEQLNIINYPFSSFTTENEKQAEGLFIEPVDYSLIKDSFSDGRTIIMSGNRGTGKTAMLYNLKRNVPESALVVYVDNYGSIKQESDIKEFYELLARSIVNSMLEQLPAKLNLVRHLSKSDKLFLSFLINSYSTQTTQRCLREAIEKIQLSPAKRMVNNCSTFLGAVVNFGLTTACNTIKNSVFSYFALPEFEEDTIKNILPEIKFYIDDNFNSVETTYDLILKICDFTKKLNFTKVIVFFDKIDEDNRWCNDADIIAEFIKPMLTDNKLLLNPTIQFVFSIWAVPFALIKDSVRTQKYYCPELVWGESDLLRAFNRRLEVYSNSNPKSFNEFFDDDISEVDKADIFNLANHNPRDLWHIFDKLLKAQYKMDPTQGQISKSAFLIGLKEFVEQFNYFEYYPRKKNSRADTMDIYRYITHLLTLKTIEFTANQLNISANLGGSTVNNYIAGMQKIGLITKTDKKQNSGMVYRITDPKVIYAIHSGHKINKL